MSDGVREFLYHQVLVSPELGGAGLAALQLATTLHREGRTSRVWIPGEGPALRQALELELPVQRYEAQALFRQERLRSLVVNWRMGRRLRRQGPGVVHVHGPLHYGALHIGLWISGLKRVVHVQIEEEMAGLRWALRWPPELILTCARFLVEPVRRALPAHAREQQRIVAVPNPVALERYYPGDKAQAQRRLGHPPGRPLLLMLANLAPHKGQETVLRAVALLKERGIDAACWLAGIERDRNGTYLARLQTLVGELGIQDQVQFLGFRQDGPDLLRAADCLLLPSTREGLPLAILEAQATRVPVLAAPTAGIPEVITEGDTGFLIPADDVVGYANGVERLLRHPDLAQQIAERAYVRVTRDHNQRSYCQRILELYHELVGCDRKKRRWHGENEHLKRTVARNAHG